MRRLAMLGLAGLLLLGACGNDMDPGEGPTSAAESVSDPAQGAALVCDGFDAVERQRDLLAEEEDLETVAEALRRLVGGLQLIIENADDPAASLAEELLDPFSGISEVMNSEDLSDSEALERIQSTPEFAAYRAPRVRDGSTELLDLRPSTC